MRAATHSTDMELNEVGLFTATLSILSRYRWGPRSIFLGEKEFLVRIDSHLPDNSVDITVSSEWPALNSSEKIDCAMFLQSRMKIKGFGEIRLKDQGGNLLARSSRIDGGMILFEKDDFS